MASDLEAWTPEDFRIFARLLRVRREQIIQHSVGLRERRAYLAEIPHEGDLFLDPDTGVQTGVIKKPEAYVTPKEVGQLLDAAPNRLLMIYQHVRGQVSKRVDSVLGTILTQIGEFGWSTYESGTVAMLFIARGYRRPAEVVQHFRESLGRHAEGRIRGRVA
jgi:hypothetical protein